MVGLDPHQAESKGSQRVDHFLNLERKRDRKGSVRTTHTSRSHSRGGSHFSHKKYQSHVVGDQPFEEKDVPRA